MSDKVLIAVHGNQSHKTDVVIEIVATIAVEKGTALNIENNEMIERNRSNITSLLGKANGVWSIER